MLEREGCRDDFSVARAASDSAGPLLCYRQRAVLVIAAFGFEPQNAPPFRPLFRTCPAAPPVVQ